MAAMYVGSLLTDWYVSAPCDVNKNSSLTLSNRNIVSNRPIEAVVDPDANVYIGRSEVAMWMRVVSSWVCILLYGWSLVAPVILPDRFGDI
jgi:hypothetical protein